MPPEASSFCYFFLTNQEKVGPAGRRTSCNHRKEHKQTAEDNPQKKIDKVQNNKLCVVKTPAACGRHPLCERGREVGPFPGKDKYSRQAKGEGIAPCGVYIEQTQKLQ